jgi:hypothetical protein
MKISRILTDLFLGTCKVEIFKIWVNQCNFVPIILHEKFPLQLLFDVNVLNGQFAV